MVLCLLLQPALVEAFTSRLSPLTIPDTVIMTSRQKPPPIMTPTKQISQHTRIRPLLSSTLPQDRPERQGRRWRRSQIPGEAIEYSMSERKPILSTVVEVLASKLVRKTARRVTGLDVDVGARSNSDVLAGNLPLVKVREAAV